MGAGTAYREVALRARVARGRSPEDDWGEVHRTVLGNGLRVLTARAPGLHSAMIALYVRAGSRHEAPETQAKAALTGAAT